MLPFEPFDKMEEAEEGDETDVVDDDELRKELLGPLRGEAGSGKEPGLGELELFDLNDGDLIIALNQMR